MYNENDHLILYPIFQSTVFVPFIAQRPVGSLKGDPRKTCTKAYTTYTFPVSDCLTLDLSFECLGRYTLTSSLIVIEITHG